MTKPFLYSAIRNLHSAFLLALLLSCLLPALAWPCAYLGSGNPPPSGPPPGCPGQAGDPVDCFTGLFLYEHTDFALPDTLPITLKRTYRHGDTAARPFGKGTTHPYEWFLIGDRITYTYAELILADGGRIRYTRTSPGTSYTGAVMRHSATPTRFYQSVLAWNSERGGWDITLKDGTVYEFFVDFGPEIVMLTAIQDRYGNRLTITRDANRRITKITSPNGRWLAFTYDTSSRVTQATDNLGRTVGYTYDTSGRLQKVTDPIGGVTEYTYDTAHRMLTVKDPRGNTVVTNQYNATGRVSQQTLADGGIFLFAYTLDANNKVIQTTVTDPRGNLRRFTFNPDGQVLTNTQALGTPEQQTTTYEREAGTNLVLAEIDPLGRRTAYTYDVLGNVTRVTRLAGTAQAVTTTFTYEPLFNQIASLTDPLNHTISFAYNSVGSLIRVTNPVGEQMTLTYNADGQPVTISDPLGHTVTVTYERGDLVAVTDPVGNTTTRFTDSIGRLLSLTNPLGHTTEYEYDSLNRLTTVMDALGGQTLFTYDRNNNLLSLTDAKNSTTRYTYTARNWVATRTDPLSKTESYQYDGEGNLTQMTDRKGQGTTSTYDALNRRTHAAYADSSTTTYSYDAGDRLTQVVDSQSGTIVRSYDGLDRLTAEGTPQGTVSYTYDAAGRRVAMNATGQPTVTYFYDNADRLTQLNQGSATVGFVYDVAGRRTSLTLPNGIVVAYGYDDASRLTSLTYMLGGSVLGNLTYTYNAAGQRVQVSGTEARTGLPQPLTSATYNAANRMLTFGAETLGYDNNGNLTSDGTDTFVWNARNRLASVSGPGLTASFIYDSFGRRVKKTVNGVSRDFLYDRANPIQELSGATITASQLTGLGIDEVFSRTEGAVTHSLLPDALGSTVALTDSARTVQTQYTYEPFGETTISGAASLNPFQFTGRENDGTTGLYYYRARYYHPVLQRFISEDPIGFAGRDVNLYGYVGNDPVNLIDPDGLIGIDSVLQWLGKQAVKKIGGKLGKEAAGEGHEGSSPEQTQMETDVDGDGIPDFFDPEPFDNPNPFTPAEPAKPEDTCR